MKSNTKKTGSKMKGKSPSKHTKSIKVVVHKPKSTKKTIKHSAKAARLILRDFEKDIESGKFLGPIQVIVESGKSKKARQFVGGQIDMADTDTSSLPMNSVPDTTIVKPEETSSQPPSMIMPTGTMMQPNAPPQSGTMVSDTTTMSEPVTQAQQPLVVSQPQPQTQPQQQAIPSVTVNISAPATTAPFGGPTQQTTDDSSTTVSKPEATPEQTPSLGLLSMPTEEGETKEVEPESDETQTTPVDEPEATPVVEPKNDETTESKPDETQATPVDEPETINVVTSDAEPTSESKPITVDDETALLDKIASSLREESSQLQSLSTEISKSKSMTKEEADTDKVEDDEEEDQTTTTDEESAQQQPSIPEYITTSPSAEVKPSEPSSIVSQPPLTPATPPSPTFVQKMSEIPKEEAKTIDNVRMASHHLFNWVNESLFGDDTKANGHFNELQKYITSLFPTGEEEGKKDDDSVSPMELVGGRKRKYKKKSKMTKKKNKDKREAKKGKKASKKAGKKEKK